MMRSAPSTTLAVVRMTFSSTATPEPTRVCTRLTGSRGAGSGAGLRALGEDRDHAAPGPVRDLVHARRQRGRRALGAGSRSEEQHENAGQPGRPAHRAMALRRHPSGCLLLEGDDRSLSLGITPSTRPPRRTATESRMNSTFLSGSNRLSAVPRRSLRTALPRLRAGLRHEDAAPAAPRSRPSGEPGSMPGLSTGGWTRRARLRPRARRPRPPRRRAPSATLASRTMSGAVVARRERASTRSMRSADASILGSEAVNSRARENSSYSVRHRGHDARWPSSPSRSACVSSSSQQAPKSRRARSQIMSLLLSRVAVGACA